MRSGVVGARSGGRGVRSGEGRTRSGSRGMQGGSEGMRASTGSMRWALRGMRWASQGTRSGLRGTQCGPQALRSRWRGLQRRPRDTQSGPRAMRSRRVPCDVDRVARTRRIACSRNADCTLPTPDRMARNVRRDPRTPDRVPSTRDCARASRVGPARSVSFAPESTRERQDATPKKGSPQRRFGVLGSRCALQCKRPPTQLSSVAPPFFGVAPWRSRPARSRSPAQLRPRAARLSRRGRPGG